MSAIRTVLVLSATTLTAMLIGAATTAWYLRNLYPDSGLPPRRLPVQVHIRDSAIGLGRVLEFSNTSPRYLVVKVSANNPTFASNQVFAVDLPGHAMRPFGWLEGLKFASGDRVTLEQSGYAPTVVTIP
jgi:hypothetical protein